MVLFQDSPGKSIQPIWVLARWSCPHHLQQPGFPMRKIGKGQRTTASLPFHSLCSPQRGTKPAGFHTVAADGWQLSEGPLMSSSSPGTGKESDFQSSQLWTDSWVQEEIGNFTVQPMMLPLNLGLGSWGTNRKKKMETLIDFRCFRG